jgi:protein ImuB
MFASLYVPGIHDSARQRFIECAYKFSPILEETAPDTLTLNISGLELLFGPYPELPERICAELAVAGLQGCVAVASNPDAAMHAARGFLQNVYVPPGKEAEVLSPLPINVLIPKFAGIPDERLQEILQTLNAWGILQLGQLAGLPSAGLAERLGRPAAQLQKMASGQSLRSLIPHTTPPMFHQKLALEHPIATLEPLLFALAHLINRQCAALKAANLAAQSLEIAMSLTDRSDNSFIIRLPFPIREPKILLKILEIEIGLHSPRAPVCDLEIRIEPAPSRVIQPGLFYPRGPEPEKLELVMARIAKVVGPGNIGSPETLDTHRPDSFRLKHFEAEGASKKSTAKSARPIGLRLFRPPLSAFVEFKGEVPVTLRSRASGICSGLAGKIVSYGGPWRTSGDWWSSLPWSRDEWDIELRDGTVCRIYQDILSRSWLIFGVYD